MTFALPSALPAPESSPAPPPEAPPVPRILEVVPERLILGASHRSTTRLEVLVDQVVHAALPVIAGVVSIDSTSAIRRRCQVTLPADDADLIPRDVASLLAPYGNEIKLYRGHVGRQWAAGVFRIETARVEDSGGRVIVLEGFDRSHTIAVARAERVTTVASGTLYTDGIAALAELTWPGVPVNLSTSTAVVNQTLIFDAGADLWRDGMERMAAAIGHELFFDGDGVLTSRPPPELVEANAVYDFTDRAPSAMLEVERTFSTDPGYNVFVVTGEAAGNTTPVRAVAADNDPASPTFVGGKYGRRPRFFRSEFIHTTAQAQAAADAMLLRELGGTEQLEVTHWPLSYIEGSDVVHVARAALDVDELASIQTTRIDLGPSGSVTSRTRRRRSLVAA